MYLKNPCKKCIVVPTCLKKEECQPRHQFLITRFSILNKSLLISNIVALIAVIYGTLVGVLYLTVLGLLTTVVVFIIPTLNFYQKLYKMTRGACNW